jgi:hypothetical protein
MEDRTRGEEDYDDELFKGGGNPSVLCVNLTKTSDGVFVNKATK